MTFSLVRASVNLNSEISNLQFTHGGVSLKAKTVENPVEQDSMRYLEDEAYAALLGYKEPIRSAEIIAAMGKEQYSSKLLRHVLAASPRFTQIDRRWDLEVRYEDKQRPMERVIMEVIGGYGRPMSVPQIANELSSIYERPVDYYEGMAPRMLADKEKFFHTSDDLYGLADWLLIVTSADEADIIWDNDLDEAEISAVEKSATKVDWSGDLADAVIKLVDEMKSPVSNKVIGLLRRRVQGDSFDPTASFEELVKSPKLVWLSDGRWFNRKLADQYEKHLIKTADKLAEEIAEEAPKAVIEKAEVAEAVAPTLSLSISERDIDEVAQIVKKGESRMPLILETIFEISPRDPIYPVAAEGLSDAMRADSRFAWVGAERWRMAKTIPGHVKVIPAELDIPKLVFETGEGERLDVELEDVGLEGGLAAEVHKPLVQDVGDQDPVTEKDELPAAESARCVLARHHKKLGTFPLCQIPRSLFPLAPSLVKVTLTDGEKSSDVWVNRETGLIYDMAAWYTEDMPESGAVFELVRIEKPDEFKLAYDEKTDPLVYVSSGRIEELLALAEEAGKGDLSTLDLMFRIMADHRKGVPFITVFTEVNIVRRTTRRLVASILSSYYAFYQRPKSQLWYFDEKKIDQGFKKAKKKYIRKEQ